MTHRVDVKINLIDPSAKVPTYANEGDAGADVRAAVNRSRDAAIFGEKCLGIDDGVVNFEPGDYKIPGGATVLIDLGFKIELPFGWEMQVRSRSGLSKRGLVVANSPGTIDSTFRGTCKVLLHNNCCRARVVKPGDRIAQFVLKKAPVANYCLVDVLSETTRGAGGFGSTGVK